MLTVFVNLYNKQNDEDKQSMDWSLEQTIQFILHCTERKVWIQ